MLRSAETSRGTGPRATESGRRLGPRTFAADSPPRYSEKTPPLHVGRGPVPRYAAVYRELARDRPSRYGIGTAIGPSDVREGNPLGCACGIRGPPRYDKNAPLTVGRGPVPRHAAVCRNLARDRPSRYGIGKAIGPSAVREGQAPALRGRVTHREREVSPTNLT